MEMDMRIPVWAKMPLIIAAAGTMPLAAYGQEAQPQAEPEATAQAAGQTAEVAEQCLANLAAFSQRLNQEQFWITGWGGVGGVGWGTPAAVDGGVAVAPGTTAAPGATAPGAVMDPAPEMAAPGTGPWGAVAGLVRSPRHEIRVLFLAADVLARQGKQDGCEYVTAELVDTYETYTAQLAEAGVDPAQVVDWRQEQIALAQPVTEEPAVQRLTLDDLLGMDVRNAQDFGLGSVADVVLDRNTGQLLYVMVARGGFLGIGEDRVPVPWEHFRMAPGLNTLVLNVPENVMEAAPAIDAGGIFNPDAQPQQSQVVDEFWAGQAV
jgi:sporulation protein YlmC with PRC-barrel domain